MKAHSNSQTVLVTLAELAWLIAFGVLLVYTNKAAESKNLRHQLTDSQKLAISLKTESESIKRQYGSSNLVAIIDDLKSVIATNRATLEMQEQKTSRLSDLIANQEKLFIKQLSKLLSQDLLLAELENRSKQLLSSNAIILSDHRKTLTQLTMADSQINSLSNRIIQFEKGDVAIRRELTGLPDAKLSRVVFIVDTSSSMKNSPAWDEARSLMRMWIEHLPVEECLLINFNDRATAFPLEGFQRVRSPDGQVLIENKLKFLEAFDNARAGTFSDLLKGVRLAYGRSDPNLIVLFTDGHPHVSTQSDKSFGEAIIHEVSLHSKVPILAVAVGDYEIEGAGGPKQRSNPAISFLKSLTKATVGGNFIGR